MSVAHAIVTRAAERRWRRLTVVTLLLIPIALVNAVGFIAPVLNLGLISFYQVDPAGAMRETFTFHAWQQLFSDRFYADLIIDTILISFLITLMTLLCSYPIAFYLHRTSGSRSSILLVLVVSPLLTSAVVRTYGWIAILSYDGIINNILSGLGSHKLQIIFNSTGVVIGLTEILMPYMILALLAGFGRLDPRIEEAAATLGASPSMTFYRIILPLTLPGIALGCLLCFVLAVSSFITPKLLGGGRVFLLATEIYDQAIVTLNWPLASVLSILVLLIFGLGLTLYARALRAIA